jgi:hypothetical protein
MTLKPLRVELEASLYADWPAFGRSDMTTAARIGRVLWFASCIEWETWAFQTESMWRLMKDAPVHERELNAVMAELGRT